MMEKEQIGQSDGTRELVFKSLTDYREGERNPGKAWTGTTRISRVCTLVAGDSVTSHLTRARK